MRGKKKRKEPVVPPQVWSVPVCILFGILSSILVGSMIFLRHFQAEVVSITFTSVIYGLTSSFVLAGVLFLLVIYYRPQLLGLPARHHPAESGGHTGSAVDLFGAICGSMFAVGCIAYFCATIYTRFNYVRPVCHTANMPWIWAFFVILFVLFQLFFYFDHHRHFHRLLWMLRTERSAFLFPVRLVLVTFIGMNVNLWFYATQNEGIEDYCHLEEERYKNRTLPQLCRYSLQQCNPGMEFTNYLMPFIAEYALFMVQEVLLWFRLTVRSEEACDHAEKRSAFFQAPAGLVFGTIALCAELASFACTYYVQALGYDQQIHAEILDSVLHISAIVAFCWIMCIIFDWNCDTKDLQSIVVDREVEFKYDESIHLIVLQATYAGFALYTSVDFCVNVSIPSDEVDSYLYAVVFADLFSLIDASLQVFLVWVLSHKQTEVMVRDSKVFRGLLVYLFFYNFAIWFASSYRNVHANRNPHASESAASHVWTIVTHVAIPLTIYFRFHLAETYVHLLKVKDTQNKVSLDGRNHALLEPHMLNEDNMEYIDSHKN